MSHLKSIESYRQYLQGLASTVEDPRQGFFGADSMAWRINREGVLGLGALRALLMQVAHPKVAQGVADHSDYARKPLARAYKTLKAQQVIIFGTCEEAIEALVRIQARHFEVRGQFQLDGVSDQNLSYRANDPALKMWVYATLIDTVIRTHNTFLTPLSCEEESQLYAESRLFARLMGIPDGMVPLTKQTFDGWMAQILESNEISATKEGQAIARSLLRLPLPIFWPLNYVLAAGSLPPEIRAAYHIRWSGGLQAMYSMGVGLVSAVSRRLPLRLRATPAYWAALNRLQETP